MSRERGMKSSYHELEVVVVSALRDPVRELTGTDRVLRRPRVGDIATIVHVLDEAHYTLECVDSQGFTCWLADFHVDELAPDLTDWRFEAREGQRWCLSWRRQ